MNTNVVTPYGVFLMAEEIMAVEKTANFDTERCCYPKIAVHSDYITFEVRKNTSDNFDTKLRIYNPNISSATRVCLVFN